jgi:HSP20 family protein
MALRFPLLIPPNMFDDTLADLLDRPFEPIRIGDGRSAVRFLPLDIRDEGAALLLTASVPGVKPEELQITIEDQTLTLSAHVQREETADEPDYLLRERAYGAFRRVVTLPVKVDPGVATAEMADGVLTLRLPKAPEATAKRIEIRPTRS